MRERHTKYVNDLSKLTDSEKGKIQNSAIGQLKKLLPLAQGSPQRLVELIKRARVQVLSPVVKQSAEARIQAVKLGQDFRKSK